MIRFWFGYALWHGAQNPLLRCLIPRSLLLIQCLGRVRETLNKSVRPTALAELSTRQIAEGADATGMAENEAAAKTGGGIAKKARLELEAKTGRKVVGGENFLLPEKSKGNKRKGIAKK